MSNSKEIALQLSELNQRSAPLAAFDIAFYQPKIERYQYNDKKTKKPKNGASFRALLVCLRNPEKYVTAELSMRSDNIDPLEKALEKFKEGLCWRMNGIRLKSVVQQEYMHTSVKLIVDMGTTKFNPLMNLPLADVKHLTPQPSMSVAHCKSLGSAQRFDIIALVLQLSDPRPGGANREVRTVTLIDGTKSKDTDKLVEMKISIFSDTDTSPQKSKLLQLLTEVNGTDRSVAFFAVQCKISQDGPDFLSSKEFFALESKGPKAEQLKADQPKLALMGQETRETITSFSPGERKDYTQEQGIQVFVAHLSELQLPTHVIGDTTIWSIHWCQVTMPDFNIESITTKDGTRLWFQTTIRDLTGILTRVWMNEESALALSELKEKDQFIKAWKEGDMVFPIMSAIKIVRTVREASDDSQTTASQSNESKKLFVNYQIVEAVDQPLGEAPSQATLPLVAMLKQSAHDTDSIVPAALHQIEASPVYALEVTYDAEPKPIVLPCQQVLALIRSKEKSKVEMLGMGCKVTTADVQCVLCSDDPHHAEKKYKVSSVCTMETLAAYRLDPPPRGGKGQCALVTMTNKKGDDFIIESVQLLQEDQVQTTKNSMLKLMHLAQKVGSRDKRKEVEWTHEQDESPWKARKCTALGRSPTEAELPLFAEKKQSS